MPPLRGICLIILGVQFEIGLGMSADGANLRRLGSHHDMTAVAALPYLHFAAGKDLLGLHVAQQRPVALLMMLLNGSHAPEFGSQLREAFFLRSLGKAVVHVCPLVVFPIGGSRQILGRITNAPQFLEPQLRMLLLVVCRFGKESGNLFKTFLFCLGSKIGIFVPGLRFAGKSLPEILFRLGTCILVAHDCYLLF